MAMFATQCIEFDMGLSKLNNSSGQHCMRFHGLQLVGYLTSSTAVRSNNNTLYSVLIITHIQFGRVACTITAFHIEHMYFEQFTIEISVCCHLCMCVALLVSIRYNGTASFLLLSTLVPLSTANSAQCICQSYRWSSEIPIVRRLI